jgi:hypothetical protein
MEMADLLVAKGADPVAPSFNGTPLDVATQHNRLDIAEFFVGVIETNSTVVENSLENSVVSPTRPKTVPVSPRSVTRNRYKTVEVMQQLGVYSPEERQSPPISESILLSPRKNAVVPHSFHIRQFSRPTYVTVIKKMTVRWCEFCNGFIFGMLRQGYTCDSKI